MYPLPDESTEALRGKSINNVVVAADKLLMGKQRCDIEKMFLDLGMPPEIVTVLVDAAYNGSVVRVSFKTTNPSGPVRSYSDFKIYRP